MGALAATARPSVPALPLAKYWLEPERSNPAPGQQFQATASTPQCIECGKSETVSCSRHAPRHYLKTGSRKLADFTITAG